MWCVTRMRVRLANRPQTHFAHRCCPTCASTADKGSSNSTTLESARHAGGWKAEGVVWGGGGNCYIDAQAFGPEVLPHVRIPCSGGVIQQLLVRICKNRRRRGKGEKGGGDGLQIHMQLAHVGIYYRQDIIQEHYVESCRCDVGEGGGGVRCTHTFGPSMPPHCACSLLTGSHPAAPLQIVGHSYWSTKWVVGRHSRHWRLTWWASDASNASKVFVQKLHGTICRELSRRRRERQG